MIQLDWDAYWQRFKEVHGDPVPYNGKLLFEDGYQYSATDVMGPEYLPPDDADELRKLQVVYWVERRRVVVAERIEVETTLKGLKELQATRSVPLQELTFLFDDERGKTVATRKDLDLTALVGRLNWLKADVADCDARIASLKVISNGQK